nr:hypothetical protein [Tanacetum cinerariifolium]
DITSTTLDEGMAKTTSLPEGTDSKYQVDETQTTILRYQSQTKNEGKTSFKLDPDTEPLQLLTFVDIQAFLLSKDELEKRSDDEEVLAPGDEMDEDPQDDVEQASIEEYYKENIVHRDQTDQLVASSMSSLDKSSSSIIDLYKGLNVITELLKHINNAVKDDPSTNKKIDEAIKTFAKISTQTIEILSLVKTFYFSTLQSTMQDLQAHALTQAEASVEWTKYSTNMAWNLGSRMTDVEISQTALKHKVSSLRPDTLEIKSMMAKIYQAFKGQPSSAPSGNVTPTLALPYISSNVKGENATNTATEEPPSNTKGETGDTTMALSISSIHPTEVQSTHNQPNTSIISHPESS